MQIVKPSFSIEDEVDGERMLRAIEKAGRTCYKSQDKITDTSAREFVRKIITSGHESVLEHEKVTVRIICDRGVSHEAVRARLASYSQESSRYCVAGSASLTTSNPHNALTVAGLWRLKEASTNGAWKRVLIRQLNETTGELQFAKVADISCVGERPTIRVTTRLGYSIEVTPSHEIKTEVGYTRAGELRVGAKIAVNGTDAYYKNRDWLSHQYNTLMKTSVSIASEFGFNPSTIKKWVRIHKLPKKPSSYFNRGRKAWNAGVSEAEDPRVQAQAVALRTYHWNEGHPHDSGTRRSRLRKLSVRTYHKTVGAKCALCSSCNDLQVHHLDENRENNAPENLKTVCRSCHLRVHSKNLLVAHYDTITAIEDAGVQQVFDISMKSDYRNFVAAGVVVHNCNYSLGRFEGGITVIPLLDGLSAEQISRREDLYRHCEAVYLQELKEGVKAQQARDNLPTCLKTEVVWTANFREWRCIFKQRTSLAAHPAFRKIMVPMLAEFKRLIPVVFDDIA